METPRDSLKKIRPTELKTRRLVHAARWLADHPTEGRVASETTVATGDESSRNPWITATAREPRSGGTRRTARAVVPLLRSLSVFPSCPWVFRRLVTRGYFCFGATRQLASSSRRGLLRGVTERLEFNARDEQPAHEFAEVVLVVKIKKQPRLRNVRKIRMPDGELSSVREIDGERPERCRLQQAANLFKHGCNLHAPFAGSRS